MRQKSGPEKQPAEDAIKNIRRATRRHFSAEEKIRVVLEGLRGEESVAHLLHRRGISPKPVGDDLPPSAVLLRIRLRNFSAAALSRFAVTTASKTSPS